MAERERLTNKERRARAREERKRREAEAAKRRKRGNLRNGLITVAVVAVVGAVLIQAFAGGPDDIGETILVSSSAAEEARDTAGCEWLAENAPLDEAYHVERSSELDPDAVYTDTRPTHSGPHTAGIHPVTSAADNQIDEVSATHNLEHGAVIVWWDPEQVDAATADEIGEWAETLNANGFRGEGGGGIITSPYEDPGIGSGRAIALRAWGNALDCEAWDETVAQSFVLDHFGTNGAAPERTYSPFPEGVLAYADDTDPSGDADGGGDDATDEADSEGREPAGD